MDKKLQDLAWSILPKEFKEEVKKYYQRVCRYDNLYSARGATEILELLFGKHNLTSDAEGEDEILTVSRKKLQYFYEKLMAVGKSQAAFALQSLFGSKCLPDETKDGTKDDTKEPNVDSLDSNVDSFEPKPAEPKFKVGELCMRSGYVTRVLEYVPTREFPYSIHVLQMNLKTIAAASDLEPYTEPEEPTCTRTCTDDCPSQSRNLSQETANCDKSFDNILKGSFSKECRLHIAAMALQGILTRIDDTPQVITEVAFRYADALIDEAEKGRSDGNL